jgi:hypothetical protein
LQNKATVENIIEQLIGLGLTLRIGLKKNLNGQYQIQ